MNIITYPQLDSALQTVVGGSPHYSQFLTDAFFVLYHTGCRPVELLDRKRWYYRNGVQLVLQPAKGNLDRDIPDAGFPLSFVNWVKGSDTSFRLVTYYSCRGLFHHLFPLAQAYIGAKAADQYLFRHRYVRSLALSGLSDQEIKIAMGWNSDALVTRYSNSIIYN
jgi:hypothetical protein